MSIKLFLPFDPVISFPEICPDEIRRKVNKSWLSEMTVLLLLMVAKNQNRVGVQQAGGSG